MNFWKTPEAARQLGTSYTRLVGLLRYGKIPQPAKDSSGDFLWTEADLDRAREVMAAGRGRGGVNATPAASN
jgi:hypothetical protein